MRLARALKKQANSSASVSMYGTVESVQPLVISAEHGELMLSGSRIKLAASIGTLSVGDTVCIVGDAAPYTVVARV